MAKPKIRTDYEKITGEENVLNRGTVTSQNRNEIKDLSVSIKDVDSAIMYYMKNIIKPKVVEKDTTLDVPIMYGSPERWHSIQKNGVFRDQREKIIIPLIMFRRSSVNKDETMPMDKLDANNPHYFRIFEKKNSNANVYDRFSVLYGQTKPKEYYSIIFPDYVTVTYECVIWTEYVEHLNKIMESFLYSEGSYWGEEGKFRFRSYIEGFDNTIEQGDTDERNVKAAFTITVKGYIIPNTINKELATVYGNTQKLFSPKVVIFKQEIDETLGDKPFVAKPFRSGKARSNTVYTPPPADFTNIIAYLNKQYAKKADTIVTDNGGGTSEAIFSNVTIATVPSDWAQGQTLKENFYFFNNGQLIDYDAINTFEQSGSDVSLVVDTGSLGYSLQSSDEIYAVGKFDS